MQRFLMVCVALVATSSLHAAPVSQLELIETGGAATAGNLAAASTGAVAFSSGDYGHHHTIDKLNDGKYGNGSTWIGGAEGSFAGVRFPQAADIGGIAFGRDNSGTYADRCIGTYSFQYTETPGADASTPDDQWKELVTIDYALSPPPSPAARHLFRFPAVKATAVRVVTVRNVSAGPHPLGIDELEVYRSDDPILDKPAQAWAQREPWVSPLVKQGYLNSPLVETTPFVFKGELYIMEFWRKNMKTPEGLSGASTHDQTWVARLPAGLEGYAERQYVGPVWSHHALGTAIVDDKRVYVFGVDESSGRKRVDMTWSDDLKTWSEPTTVFTCPRGRVFNVAVTPDEGGGYTFLWETDGVGRNFTMCFGRIDSLIDPWNGGIIEGAVYGAGKYTGGPALYFANGWHYLLYLESLRGHGYETHIARSRDLKSWVDAAPGRTFLAPNRTRRERRHQTSRALEINASDAELVSWKGRTLITFTGGDQRTAADLQWATYDGTPAELFAHFFEDATTRDMVPPKHEGDWAPVLIAPDDAKPPPANAPIEALRKYRPTPRQLAYQEDQLGAFIHFGPATYVGANMHAMPKAEIFHPTKLDAKQWAKAAQSFGAKYAVLTAKHHNGFCLWPTKSTDYSVASSPWKDGQGDVVREFVTACREYGLRPGLYLSPADMHFAVCSTMAPRGKRRINGAGDRDAYFKAFMQQLEELLTGYGPLAELWFDGAYEPFGWDILDKEGKRFGTGYGDAMVALIRKHQPGAVVFNATIPDVRWSGSESGWAPYPLWNVVPEGQGTKAWLGPDDFGYIPAEANFHTRHKWFWTPGSDRTLASKERLMTAYDNTIGRGANVLINMTPDTHGLIPEVEVERLAAFGKELRRQFDEPVARTDSTKGWAEGGILILELGAGQPVSHIVIEEDLREGQRVVSYVVEALTGGQWRPLAQGLSVGRKRIHRFDPVTTGRLRLRITGAADLPVIRSFLAYTKAP